MRALPLLALLTACAPEAADLYGLWVATGDGTVRALDFHASDDSDAPPHAYSAYRYAEGEAAAEVQRGSYEVRKGDGPELVTTVDWDVDSALIGQQFGNPIRTHTRSRLKLEVDEATGDTRTYRSADALP